MCGSPLVWKDGGDLFCGMLSGEVCGQLSLRSLPVHLRPGAFLVIKLMQLHPGTLGHTTLLSDKHNLFSFKLKSHAHAINTLTLIAP